MVPMTSEELAERIKKCTSREEERRRKQEDWLKIPLLVRSSLSAYVTAWCATVFFIPIAIGLGTNSKLEERPRWLTKMSSTMIWQGLWFPLLFSVVALCIGAAGDGKRANILGSIPTAAVFLTMTTAMWMAVLLAFQYQPTCAPGSDWLSSVTPASVKEGYSIEASASNRCTLSMWMLAFGVLDAILLTTIAVAMTVYTVNWATDCCKKSRGKSTELRLEEGDSKEASQLELVDKGESADDQREEEGTHKPRSEARNGREGSTAYTR